jgi:hypothetical protein
MRLFRYRLGRYVASFSDVEARVMADLVDQIRSMLAARRTERPVDPLAVLTGMTVGPATAPDDPAVARLLPDYHHDDADISSALRTLYEPALIAAKDAAAVAMLDSLPRGGGTVRLEEGTARSWLQALNDVRLALGVRLSITEDDEDPPSASAPADSPEFAMYATYRWLSVVQESLVGAMMGEI